MLTGSEGYIGTELRTYLSLMGSDYSIVCVDKSIGVDVLDITDLYNIDIIIHLAANSSVFCKDTDKINRDNINAFEHLARLSENYRVPLIYASSASAHEKNISSFYGESKQANERFASMFCSNAIGLRLHNVYSSYPRKDTIFYNLLNNKSVDLVNNGMIYRHFTYLPDILKSIYFIISNIDNINCGIYNILNPIENTILDLALEVKKYRPELELNLVDYKRELDSTYQYVDENLPQLPINYKTIEEGVYETFQFRTHILDETYSR